MQLDAMALFALVAEHGSFTAAARQTGLPKSMVSQRIAQLEQAIGIRLLHRTTRKLSLTDAGQEYLLHCRRMLDAAHAADAAMSRLRQSPSGRLRITAPEAAGQMLLPGLIAAFRQRYPDVAVECVITDAYLDLVAERIDLALRAGKQTDSSYVARRIGSLRRVLVASPDYLSRRGQPQQPNDLITHQLLTHSAMLTWPLQRGADTLTVDAGGSSLQSSNLNYLHAMAEQGMGIAFLPWFLARASLDEGRLVVVLADFPPTDNDYYLLYPSRKHMSAALTAMLDFVAEYQLGRLLAP